MLTAQYTMRRMHLVFLCVLLCSGCASTSTFRSYTSQLSPVIANIKANQPIDLSKQFVKQTQSADKILYLMEQGRIAQLQGDFDNSQASFEDAIAAIKTNDEKAMISATGAGAQASALMVNDNAIPYKGDGYERVMLYHFQAVNYLAQNDIEGAAVEVRRANAEQEEALRQHEKEIMKAQKEAEEHKISSATPDSVTTAYASLDRFTGAVKNSFQNAYTFYLSGLVYELLGQSNDAYIDYKKALEIYPDNSYLQSDVVRLARQLKMKDDLQQWKSQYPNAFKDDPNEKSGGELIILFEDDFVPQKQQIKIPIPISLQPVQITAAAFPIYQGINAEVAPLTISEGGQTVAASEPICFMGALAVKSLKEKVPAIAIRQIIRSTAKAMTAAETQKKMGGLASLAVSAYNLISENADVRSWTTLPYDVQIICVRLSPGEHEIVVNHAASGATAIIKVDMKEQKKIIIRVFRAGTLLRWTNLIEKS